MSRPVDPSQLPLSPSASEEVRHIDEGRVRMLLVEAHPGCVAHARQSVERFWELGADRYGLWFDVVMASRPEVLTPADSLYLSLTWDQWRADEGPFHVRGRR